MLLVWSNSSSWTTLNLVLRNVESMTQSLVSDQISRGILKTYTLSACYKCYWRYNTERDLKMFYAVRLEHRKKLEQV